MKFLENMYFKSLHLIFFSITLHIYDTSLLGFTNALFLSFNLIKMLLFELSIKNVLHISQLILLATFLAIKHKI